MYVLLIIAGLIAGGLLLWRGVRTRRIAVAIMGGAIALVVPIFFAFLSFWGEALWFQSLGFSRRFWVVVLSKVGFTVLGAALGSLAVHVLVRLPPAAGATRWLPALSGGVVGGFWGFWSWDVILRFWHAVNTSIVEPVFGRDTGFYLFRLPFYYQVYWLMLGLSVLAVIAALTHHVRRPALIVLERADRDPDVPDSADPYRPLYRTLGVFLLVLAWGRYLAGFQLLYSRLGVVYGAGWTDVHARLPGYYALAVILALAGIFVLVPAGPRWLEKMLANRLTRIRWRQFRALAPMGAGLAGIAALWLLALGVVPGILQWLRVSPNEVTVERPYLSHNIAFTRQAFGLDDVREQEFPVSETFDAETVAANREVLSEVRLWDPRALEAVYQQFQAIRLYYDISDVDIDRYTVNGQYRQIMISAREMQPENLPRESQTFVNRRFKYTHGHGVVMAPSSDFVSGGLPNLLVQDIPPRSAAPALEVKRPEIYYGERTREHVVVNTREPEFDYPSGNQNVYTRYSGTGGVQLTSFFRKFLFGWKFDGSKLLFSGYPTSESRILFRRAIRDRVAAVAPFLELDEDPYVVVANGRVHWILDTYTTSAHYPYSEPFSARERIETTNRAGAEAGVSQDPKVPRYLHGSNYVRNAVKVVVDAFDGTVKLYVFEPADPIVQVWQRIFPDLFSPKEEMPAELLAHVRYPQGLLLAQGLVYQKYHMRDPAVFYNQEDLWVRATERYYEDVRPVDPYYVMWKPPGAQSPQFVLMQPFTPKNRQVLIGWIAGMSDAPNYGRLFAYRFPKDKRVLGTQQVDTRIDQDPVLSAQIHLWDQRGSRVIRGNVLVIPIADTLLYVEPIYIQAEAAAYPELRVVVLIHNDRMSYASTFEAALRGLVEGRAPGLAAITGDGRPPAAEARQSFEGYLRLMSQKRFDEAARALEQLDQALPRLPADGAPRDTRRGRAQPPLRSRSGDR